MEFTSIPESKEIFFLFARSPKRYITKLEGEGIEMKGEGGEGRKREVKGGNRKRREGKILQEVYSAKGKTSAWFPFKFTFEITMTAILLIFVKKVRDTGIKW